MPNETADLETIAKRLAALEEENRRLKLAGLVAIALVASLILLAAVIQRALVPPRLTARAFVLKDEKGNTRASLDMKGGVGLRLYDEGARQGAALQLAGPGGNLELYARDGAQVSASAEGPRLRLIDRQGFRAILGNTQIVVPETGQPTDTTAASLALFDKAGRGVFKAP